METKTENIMLNPVEKELPDVKPHFKLSKYAKHLSNFDETGVARRIIRKKGK